MLKGLTLYLSDDGTVNRHTHVQLTVKTYQ